MVAQAHKRVRVAGFRPVSRKEIILPMLWSEKAERAVIGSVLQKPELFPSLSHLLQPADFYSLFLGLTWYVMDRMVSNGESIDIITLSTALEKEKGNPYKGQEDAMMIELSSLFGAASEPDHVEAYAREVKEAAMKMRVLMEMDALRTEIYSGALYGEKLKDEVNRRMFEATEQSSERRTDMQAMMGSFIDSFEGGVLTNTVPTGFAHLDAILSGHGLFPGEVTIWAGAEGMGKTTALLSIARNAARLHRTIAIFTMEMEQSEISLALTSMETGIARAAIQSKRISTQQWELIVSATGVIGSYPIHVIDMHEFPALKPLQLRRKLRSLMVRTPVDLVILDGLWLMEPDEPTPNRPEAVGKIMRDLSGIAKQFQLPLLVAHQYKEEIRAVKKPTIYQLAESSGVRRNAQVIIGMWRSSYFKDDASAQTYAYVLKNRNRGMLGSAPLPYNLKYNRFGDEYE